MLTLQQEEEEGERKVEVREREEEDDGGRSRLPRGTRQNETKVSRACRRTVVNFVSIVNSEASWIKEGAMMRKATC